MGVLNSSPLDKFLVSNGLAFGLKNLEFWDPKGKTFLGKGHSNAELYF